MALVIDRTHSRQAITQQSEGCDHSPLTSEIWRDGFGTGAERTIRQGKIAVYMWCLALPQKNAVAAAMHGHHHGQRVSQLGQRDYRRVRQCHTPRPLGQMCLLYQELGV